MSPQIKKEKVVAKEQETLEDSHGPEEYDPGLYTYSRLVDTVDGFGSVGDAEVEQFHRNGFLAIQNAYSQDQVSDALEAIAQLTGDSSSEVRVVQFERGLKEQVQEADGEARELLVRKLTRFVGHDPRLDVFGEDLQLLDILSRIMGEPAKLFANQAMLKPPGIGREKPWHQDHAYFNLPMGTCIVSAWVALDKADPENGCMHVIPASHQDGPVVHFKRRDWQICDTDIARNRVEAVALEPGGVLFWHGRLHHGSPANRSDRRRRALQLHFVPESVETIETEERLAVYGSEGKDVTC